MGNFDEPLQFFQASLSLKQSDQLFNLYYRQRQQQTIHDSIGLLSRGQMGQKVGR